MDFIHKLVTEAPRRYYNIGGEEYVLKEVKVESFAPTPDPLVQKAEYATISFMNTRAKYGEIKVAGTTKDLSLAICKLLKDED